MGFLRLLLNSGLLFLGATALIINRRSHLILTDEGSIMSYNVIPQHYDINLKLFDTDRIIIECKVYIQIKHPTRFISFQIDLSQMLKFEIRSLSSANNQFNVSKIYEPINCLYHEEDHTIYIFFNDEISSGFYVLNIPHLTFHNLEDGNNGSLFRTSYLNEVGKRMWIVVTDFQAIGARKLFPCWDKPVFRATFNISIKHHSDYTVLSNMPVQKIHETTKSNIMWTVFEKTPLMPTYQVSAILMMHLSSIRMDKAHILLRRQLDSRYILFAIDIINKVTDYLKSHEKCFQKFTEVIHVVIPGFLHDAVTNLGLIYYRETAILYDEKEDSAVRETEVARLIGRTVAYQCFDRTIPSQWSYMWLNEGIAMLLGMDAVDEVYPQLRIKDYFVVQIQQESLRFDTDSIMKPLISEVNDPSEINSISYYLKAPVIMRMLQQILTNTVFRKGINMYLNKEASLLGTTTSDDLWVAMQTAYDETCDYNKERLNIKQIMDAWTKQQHYPVVKIIQRDSFTFVKYMNKKAYKKKHIKKHWWLPYTIATQTDPDFFLSNRSHQPKMLNFSATEEFLYNTTYNKWIIVNTQQIGYYRVNYAKSLLNIVRYLNSDKYAKIHVLNRAQIIDDAYYFLMKGQLNLSTFLELARYLSQEKDYIAWYPMIKAFEYMSCFFPFPRSTYIKNTMIKILDILLKEKGYEVYERIEAGPIESLTEEAAKWACTLGSLKCRKKDMAKLTTDLIKKKICSSICMRMNEWLTSLCNGLKEQVSRSWDWVLKQYIENSDYTILKFLAYSDNFFNIRNNVDLIALCEKTQDDVRVYIFHYIVARHVKNDTTLNYILENFDKVKPRNISGTVALVDIINHVYSNEQLYKIAEVATDNLQYFTIRNKVLSIISKIEMRISQIIRLKNQFYDMKIL